MIVSVKQRMGQGLCEKYVPNTLCFAERLLVERTHTIYDVKISVLFRVTEKILTFVCIYLREGHNIRGDMQIRKRRENGPSVWKSIS